MQAWQRIVNRYSVAAMFYVSAAFVLSHMFVMLHLQSFESWLFESAFFMRQFLISGFLMLLAIGCIEAVLDGRVLRAGFAALARAAAVAVAAGFGVWLRWWLTHGAGESWGIEWAWVLSTAATWMLIGGLGFALIKLAHDDAAARERLDNATCDGEALAAQKLQAQLSALQAQIEPHFLFNTLAHVKRLYEIDPSRGRDMLKSLIDYLHAALPGMRRTGSTLRRELELARSFLTILKLRMGERLAFDIRVDADLLDAAMPPMIVPTLVENAIKHGIAPLPNGGRIDIFACRSADGRLLIEVHDDGRGFVGSSGSGVGLANTRSRLAALFGEQAALELAAGQPSGVTARVVLPLQRLAVVP